GSGEGSSRGRDADFVAVSSDPVNGPLIGILPYAGFSAALVKQGSLSAGWNNEYPDADCVALYSR
ncbi:MAG TPA: hypothetical protein DEH11_10930, partial [Actinobacteria bacterium]|nr:hypothetical protein [Actinomycetota bacterium]